MLELCKMTSFTLIKISLPFAKSFIKLTPLSKIYKNKINFSKNKMNLKKKILQQHQLQQIRIIPIFLPPVVLKHSTLLLKKKMKITTKAEIHFNKKKKPFFLTHSTLT
jgi:tRNA/tmRNA/rRNA uracil-C5-methylase (TrmA/RlmC/RlmD family)